MLAQAIVLGRHTHTDTQTDTHAHTMPAGPTKVTSFVERKAKAFWSIAQWAQRSRSPKRSPKRVRHSEAKEKCLFIALAEQLSCIWGGCAKPEPEPVPEPELDHGPATATQLFTQYICVIVPSVQFRGWSSTSISVDLQQAEDATADRFLSLSRSLSLPFALSCLSDSWAWAYLCAWENIRWPQLKVARLTTSYQIPRSTFPITPNHNKNNAA